MCESFEQTTHQRVSNDSVLQERNPYRGVNE
jgi:hypothetical protein